MNICCNSTRYQSKAPPLLFVDYQWFCSDDEKGLMAMQTSNVAKAEDFAMYMTDTLNKGLLSLLISMGQQTALLDTLSN